MIRPRTNRLSIALAAASVCSFTAAGFMLRPMETNGLGIHNDYLVLSVQESQDETDFAGYTLRKNSGDSSETLTYSQYCTSFAELNINGTVKLFSEGKNVKAPTAESDGSVVTVQDFDGVEVTQRLSFTTGNTSNYDMLRIEYTAANKTGEDVNFSVRTIIDPTIADSESDPVCAGDKAYTSETGFTGSSIPQTWCIKNSAGAVTAYGITSDGTAATDSFDIADWSHLYDQRFGYRPSGEISDNAVALTWSDKTVKAGETFACGTKYGLYSETPGSGDNSAKTDAPKTGDKGAYVFAGTGVCALAAAVIFRKRRAEEDE